MYKLRIAPDHAQLRSDHSDKLVPIKQAMDTMFLFLRFQASKNFTQLAGQNGTRLVARFDWNQRFVTEPPSY